MVDSTHQQPQGPVSLTKDSAPDDSDPQCDICHEPFLTGENQEIPIALPCGHEFGSFCLASWLEPEDGRRSTCPMCRAGPYRIRFDGRIVEYDPPVENVEDIDSRLLDNAVDIETHMQRILGFTYHTLTFRQPDEIEPLQNFIRYLHRTIELTRYFQDFLRQPREFETVESRLSWMGRGVSEVSSDINVFASKMITEAVELGIIYLIDADEGESGANLLEAASETEASR